MCNPLPGADLHKLPPGHLSWRPVLPLERQITISLSASDTSATRRWQQTILRAKGQRKATTAVFCFCFFLGGGGDGMAGKLESEERNFEPPTPAVSKWAPPFCLSCVVAAGSCSSRSKVDCPSFTSGSYHPEQRHKHRHACRRRSTITSPYRPNRNHHQECLAFLAQSKILKWS